MNRYEVYEALVRTEGWRQAAGVLFFVGLGLFDRWRNRDDPKRAKEYLFLLFATATAIVYGIVQGQVAATISEEYFLFGHELAVDVNEGRPFRLAVALVAVETAWRPGVLLGVGFLLANNSWWGWRPRLSYRQLAAHAWAPLALAAVGAAAGGVLFLAGHDTPGARRQALEFVSKARLGPYLFVAGMGEGAFPGAAVGTLIAMVRLVIRRRRLVTPGVESGA